MATNCYQKFKDTYRQALADGLATAVAQAAAQSVMDDCLRSLSTQTTPAQPIVSVEGGRFADPGPSGRDRGGDLGKKDKP